MRAGPATALVALCAVSMQVYAQYTNVHIKADPRTGRGITVTRGAECFVLTAAHVVQDPAPIIVIGEQRRRASGHLHWSNTTADLAALQLTNAADVCGRDSYLDPETVLGKVQRGTVAVLGGRSEDGTVETTSVTISSWDASHLIITAAGALHEGMSGSVLYVDNEPAGILVSVATGAAGQGKVLRIDRVEALVNAFLPLRRPTDEQALHNPKLANDILHKNLNFLETATFCERLYSIARWLYEVNPPLRYASKKRIGLDYHFQIPSLVIPGTSSEYYSYKGNEGRTFRQIKTHIGQISQMSDIEGLEKRATGAIASCVRKVDSAPNLGYRSGPSRKHDRTSWELAYKNRFGMTMGSIDVWLKIGATLELDVWGAFR